MINALFCNPGPGDTLRFFHALCELKQEKDEKIVLFCLSCGFQKTGELLRHMIPFGEIQSKNGFQIVQSEEIEIHIAEDVKILNYLLYKYAQGTVFYCFETEYFKKKQKVLLDCITTGTDANYVLLDRFNNQYYMRNRINDHLHFVAPSKKHQKTGLLFVRLSEIIPERNLSLGLFSEIIDLGNSYGVNWKTAGSFLPEDYQGVLNRFKENSKLYSNQRYPDYYQQICDYSEYQFAIGMNSGALDLAAAAGLPIIRIGEYHQCLPYLGLHYNDYLACARTVNILSNSENDISNITIDLLKHAFDLLMQSEEFGIFYEL